MMGGTTADGRLFQCCRQSDDIVLFLPISHFSRDHHADRNTSQLDNITVRDSPLKTSEEHNRIILLNFYFMSQYILQLAAV
jgi:hypothetical protein